MKVLKLALCAAVASMAVTTAAAASPFSFNAGVASDYVFRGYTQTMEDPEIFGGVDYAQDMFYAGAWASNVKFGDETDAEVDLYAGVTPTLGPVAANFGVIYYTYVNAPDDSDYNYVELKAAGSVPVGPATLGAAVYYSPEFFGKTGEAWYSELNGAYSPVAKITFSGALGRQTIEDGDDYNTWNLGATVAVTDHLSIDARYHDTDIDDALCEDVCDSRGVVTLKATF